ncbi:MFS transporter, UMF1 family [Nocardioides exalbidus]|uniref:MFS transporter, UMF1 family n=1 Tax=Nocardioides exalbidus TaxID=402596 RepID=A0A1H4XX37_9ACTN|nr:MFS transporter [Nocardioides exalbidus]SED10256.1 MFS transporter, UMF1 family [Nocardioides exalbidus]
MTNVDGGGVNGGVADLEPLALQKEQKAWYWYDWANSAYVTTVSTVLFAPYIIAIAKEAAVDNRISLLGLSVAPGSLPSYLVTISTIISAIVLPLMGPIADRTANKKRLLATFAWLGALSGSLIFFATGSNWQIGAVGFFLANILLGASLVVNDSILPLISDEENRDRVSSRGWAWGYLGGGLLLAVNLALVTLHDTFGLTEGMAARTSMLSACIWWAAFTLIPYLKLRDHEPVLPPVEGGKQGILAESFGQLGKTLRELPKYPVALNFLLAYLFFNDGIQTVIASASTYGSEELGFGQSVLIGTILLVQFVAFGGALVFGRLAARFGSKHTILGGLVVWMVIVTAALFLPEKGLVPFLLLGVAIGIVLGGTQALARSYFSLLIPRGKEAEYFSFYHAMDRGTSWFGTLVFGLVYQLTDSYRPAIFALIAFFVLGGALLLRVDTAKGIRDAGNDVPAVI